MTPLQKQALFTLRQALALCEEAGIRIVGFDGIGYAESAGLVRAHDDPMDRGLSIKSIDEFEKELGDA